MTNDEKLLVEAFLDFEYSVRSNIGFDEEKFDCLCMRLSANLS